MNTRLVSFDYLRAISIMGIVCCHYFFNWQSTMGLGRFFASTFNVLFIAMSGLLLGLSWKKKGRSVYAASFLKHRFGKLARTYYPFLVLMFAFYSWVAHYPVTMKDVAIYVAFLPWFDKLHGFEHLWFLTMIAFCYMGAFAVGRCYPHIAAKLNGGVSFCSSA